MRQPDDHGQRGEQVVRDVYLLEASGTRLIGNVVVDARNAAIFINNQSPQDSGFGRIWP